MKKQFLDTVPVLDNSAVQFVLCIIFDIVGVITYIVPGIGELFDIAWAPVQGLFIWALLGGNGRAGFYLTLGFAEEILPFTDFIPGATLAYAYKYRWIR